jgi:hypothetical protein
MKQSPLGVNVLASLLQNKGITINVSAASYMGSSTGDSNYTFGTLCSSTCIDVLTQSIQLAYADVTITDTTYNNLISIGSASIPALGNSPPTSYTYISPYDRSNLVTQYGYVRLFALQAYNELNYNGTYAIAGEYRDFLSSFITASGFIDYSNSVIYTVTNAPSFLSGTYSNMNDLTSSDITGVSLSTTIFGQDLIALGKAINLSTISSFGLPSNLLQTIQQCNAISQSLRLALLSSGLSVAEISAILRAPASTTTPQQRKIYGSFLIMVGQDLADILVPLNCKTTGLNTLADLLDPQMLFPNSYQTLTVPIYNVGDTSANSKIYYPIYENGGVNSRLTLPQILSQVGTQIPAGTPNIVLDATLGPLQLPITGFGSYLQSILPTSVATAAGAFGASMMQINNISAVPIEKFAQIAMNIETTKGLPLINGTNVPVDTTEANAAALLIALGSGPSGTYTMSNFFGCMSGLPYDWSTIQQLILNTQTTTLVAIYQQLYLAVTWETATVSVQYTTNLNLPLGPTTYTVTGVTLTDPGGGYGRGGSSAPAITISNGGTGITTIGTDPNNMATFGRVTTVALSSVGVTGTTIPTAVVGAPLTTKNPAIQQQIDLANAEIAAIQVANANADKLNTTWSSTGTQLTIEQQARALGLPTLPIPRDNTLSVFPTIQYSFADTLPVYALNTNPNMYAQTLEAIADMTIVGGQSIVGMMRETRNQTRLLSAGITLDNKIPDALSQTQQSTLIANGVLPGTAPSYPTDTQPYGFYTPATNTYQITNPLFGTGPLDTGASSTPGSFAGSKYTNLVPAALDVVYTSDILQPATLASAEAIDTVIHCNCDCWASP